MTTKLELIEGGAAPEPTPGPVMVLPTGEIVDDTDWSQPASLDEAIERLAHLVPFARTIRAMERELKAYIAEHSEITEGTGRIIRGGFVATVSKATPTFETAPLRAMFLDEGPLGAVARKYLTLAEVKPDMRKCKKLLAADVSEDDKGALATFVRELRAAAKPIAHRVSVSEVDG